MAGVPNHIASVLSLCVFVMFVFFLCWTLPQTPSLEWAYGWGFKSYSVSFKFVSFLELNICVVLVEGAHTLLHCVVEVVAHTRGAGADSLLFASRC